MKFKMTIDRKVFLLLLLWSVAVLMLLSLDSPIHGSYNRADSSWLYMAGKAWMCGLKPYVDFTDSKGPLLWLIYGIGYLLAPHSYVGVYWLSCILYAGIFYYDYKIARLFLDDRRSIMAALLMTFVYFWHWYHYEVRAEDFSTLFVTISLYQLLRLLCQPDGLLPDLRHTSLTLGACFMALVLIKYNIALMQGSMILVVLWYYHRQCNTLLPPLKWHVIGAVAVALPFVVYFVVTGTWSAFIHEYFVNTFLTVQPGDKDATVLSSYYEELMAAIHSPIKITLLLCIIYGGWLLSYRLPHYRFAPMFVGVCFFLVSTRHNYDYYYAICDVFLLYLIIHSLSLLRKPLSRWGFIALMLVVAWWGIYENTKKGQFLERVAIWAENDDKEFFNAMNQYIADCPKPHPLILNLLAFEYGFGIEQETLPVGKYWSLQNGMTSEMKREHAELLTSRKADFIIAYDEKACKNFGFPRDVITRLGYERCYSHTHKNISNKKVTSTIYRKINK